jgi:hypothetical protein
LFFYGYVEEFADPSDDDEFNLGFDNDLFKIGDLVLAYNYGNSTRIIELMDHFPPCIHGICINNHQSSVKGPVNNNRVL